MRTVRVWLSCLCILVALFVSSCKQEVDQNAWSSQQEVVDQFYSMSVNERIASFAEYSFDQQYAIYIYGNQVQHPPALYLVDEFAAEGQEIVAPLLERLTASAHEATTRDLILVFSAMQRSGTYDVARDESLMRRLSEAAEGMQETKWKKIVQNELGAIRSSELQNTR